MKEKCDLKNVSRQKMIKGKTGESCERIVNLNGEGLRRLRGEELRRSRRGKRMRVLGKGVDVLARGNY